MRSTSSGIQRAHTTSYARATIQEQNRRLTVITQLPATQNFSLSHRAHCAGAHVQRSTSLQISLILLLFEASIPGIGIAPDRTTQGRRKEIDMAGTEKVETAVLQYLDQQGTVTMEDVIRRFHHLPFNQVFVAVDQLSRKGKIYLARRTPCGYAISSSAI